MNIHLSAILMFTRYQGFDTLPNDLKKITGILRMIFLGTFSQGFSICNFDYGEGRECRTCSVEIGPEIEANGRLLSYL